jgi:hypothetical protein
MCPRVPSEEIDDPEKVSLAPNEMGIGLIFRETWYAESREISYCPVNECAVTCGR